MVSRTADASSFIIVQMADFAVAVTVRLRYLWVVFNGLFGCPVRHFIARHAYTGRDPVTHCCGGFEIPIVACAVTQNSDLVFAPPSRSLGIHQLIRADSSGTVGKHRLEIIEHRVNMISRRPPTADQDPASTTFPEQWNESTFVLNVDRNLLVRAVTTIGLRG